LKQFDQQFREGFESMVCEESNPVFDSYVSELENDSDEQISPLESIGVYSSKLVRDCHDAEFKGSFYQEHIPNQNLKEEEGSLQPLFVSFSELQKKKISLEVKQSMQLQQQLYSSDQLEFCHDFHDSVAIYMETIFPKVFNVVSFIIQTACSSEYELLILLQNIYYFCTLLFPAIKTKTIL
jgi:hypothetical protein